MSTCSTVCGDVLVELLNVRLEGGAQPDHLLEHHLRVIPVPTPRNNNNDKMCVSFNTGVNSVDPIQGQLSIEGFG